MKTTKKPNRVEKGQSASRSSASNGYLRPILKMIATIDQVETGEKARQYRKSFNLSLRTVAKTMGYSPAFLSDLERGNRRWTDELITKFNMATNYGR